MGSITGSPIAVLESGCFICHRKQTRAPNIVDEEIFEVMDIHMAKIYVEIDVYGGLFDSLEVTW
jgi:hypothetical protein